MVTKNSVPTAKMEEIVQAFPPVHSIRLDAVEKRVNTEEYPLFIVTQLDEAVLLMKAKKHQD